MPSAVELPVEVGPARRGDADHRDHRGDADRDAQRGQERPQRPGPQPDAADPQHVPRPQPGRASAAGQADGHAHARPPAPSRIRTCRGRPSAISRSWVITTTVVPAACSSRSSSSTAGAGGRVEVAGRLVGQQQRRLADHRPGDRHPLPLAAGQLVRPVVEPVAQPDPVQRAPRPAAAAPAAVRRRRAGRRPRCPARGTPAARWNCWKTKPIRRARSADSCRSDSVATSCPSIRTRARRWAGRGCRSGAASSTCPSRTARRSRPARRRSIGRSTPRSAATPPGYDLA